METSDTVRERVIVQRLGEGYQLPNVCGIDTYLDINSHQVVGLLAVAGNPNMPKQIEFRVRLFTTDSLFH